MTRVVRWTAMMSVAYAKLDATPPMIVMRTCSGRSHNAHTSAYMHSRVPKTGTKWVRIAVLLAR
jgi:hypothetical protein